MTALGTNMKRGGIHSQWLKEDTLREGLSVQWKDYRQNWKIYKSKCKTCTEESELTKWPEHRV